MPHLPKKTDTPLPTSPPHESGMEQAVEQFLKAAGFSLANPHLTTTPSRVTECWQEHLIDGYQMDPSKVLLEHFPTEQSGTITVHNISVQGLCPHHLLPFFGVAHVSYIPRGKMVGFSHIAELVRCYTHRLTLQEEATHNIAYALVDILGAKGAHCSITAQHFCMKLRGKNERNSSVTTSAIVGTILPPSLPPNQYP